MLSTIRGLNPAVAKEKKEPAEKVDKAVETVNETEEENEDEWMEDEDE